MSGMELISSKEVLDICRRFGEFQWRFATSEGEAEPVDRRRLNDDEFRQLGEVILQKLHELGDIYSAFITAARRELNIPALSSR
jgi:hypothetical protein